MFLGLKEKSLVVVEHVFLPSLSTKEVGKSIKTAPLSDFLGTISVVVNITS